jgi:hypothetical protein
MGGMYNIIAKHIAGTTDRFSHYTILKLSSQVIIHFRITKTTILYKNTIKYFAYSKLSHLKDTFK